MSSVFDSRNDPASKADVSPAGTPIQPSKSDTKEALALSAYLERAGLGEYVAAFRAHGVTSLKLLRMIDSTQAESTRTAICQMIAKGWKIGDTRHMGSELAASLVKSITAEDVQTWIDKEQAVETSSSRADPNAAEKEAKRKQLKQAISEVEDLRKACADKNFANNEAEKKKVADKLEKIIGEFRAEKALDALPTGDALGKELTTYFHAVEVALANVSKLTSDAVSTRKLTAVDLIYGHQLLRGRYTDANGTTEAPGGAVLAMPKRCTDADLFGPSLESQDFSRDYRSESALMRAERLIETHGSSLSASASASGAAFMGSGIGAMSLAAQYAQAKEDHHNASFVSSGRSAVQIQTRYHWSPTRQIVFATNELRLSSEALADLRVLVRQGAPEKHRASILNFMRTFGSHVFGRVTLGGWYRYTAKATAKSEDQKSKLEKAVANAMDWGVSASGSYAGLGGAATAAAAFNGSTSSARVSGNELRSTFSDNEVTISTTMLGGVDGLPREDWIGSVQYPSQWRVIQREAPVPIWVLVRGTEPSRLGLAHAESEKELKKILATLSKNLDHLATEFESVWVQEVFAESLELEGLREEAKKQETVDALERCLHDLMKTVIETKSGLTWHLPSQGQELPDTFVLNPPSALVYHNELYVCAPSKWSLQPDDGSSRYHGWMMLAFDGAQWREATGLKYRIHTVGDDKGNSYNVVCESQINPIVLNAATIELPKSGHLFVYGNRYDKKEEFACFAVYPPNVWHVPSVMALKDEIKHPVHATRPALVRFNGRVLLLSVGSDSRIFLSNIIEGDDVLDNQHMSEDKPLGDGMLFSTDRRIAGSVFNRKIYCAYREKGSARLLVTHSDDGNTWTTPIPLPVEGSCDGPGLVEYGERLYCAFAGTEGDNTLYVTSTSDGENWTLPAPIPKATCSSTPSLAVFRGQSGVAKLYCFYMSLTRGGAGQQQLAYRVASLEALAQPASAPAASASPSPSAALYEKVKVAQEGSPLPGAQAGEAVGHV